MNLPFFNPLSKHANSTRNPRNAPGVAGARWDPSGRPSGRCVPRGTRPGKHLHTGDSVMQLRHTRSLLVASLSGLLASLPAMARGPLNPPAGPVTSTYKTLSEVEPRMAVN